MKKLNTNKSLWVVVFLVSILAIAGIVNAYSGVANTVIENCEDCTVGGAAADDMGMSFGASGTRFPNGVSADTTSPSVGEVRGTTFTATGNATIGGTLNSFKTSTTTDGVDFTIAIADSDEFIWMKGTGATSTLPAVTSSGSIFRFSVKEAFATTDFTIASAEGDNINGSLFVNDAIVACSGEDKVTFVADGEEIGDFVEFISDGTNWNIVNSRGETAAKLICTDDA